MTIRDMRLERNLTQAGLSTLSGVPLYMITRLEQGLSKLRKTPCIYVYLLAKAFGVTVERLIEEEM